MIENLDERLPECRRDPAGRTAAAYTLSSQDADIGV